MGLPCVIAPLFELRSLAWTPPDPQEVDCVLMTSANAARLAGDALGSFLALPCYAVGEATAEAAHAAGFEDVVTGDSDGAEILRTLVEAGVRRPLHLCGREHIALQHPTIRVDRRVVYAADAASHLPLAAREVLSTGITALLHSPRAASHLGKLMDQKRFGRDKVTVAAISEAVAAAAGPGWRAVEVAAVPTDEALLELAAKLCKTGHSETRTGG